MVMSRGVPHILPDSPPSLRYGKVLFLPENEDLMVMDTKLKIIEILQVSATSGCSDYHHCCIFFQCLTLFCELCVFLTVHPECEVGLQDHILTVDLQESVWGQGLN